LRPNLLVLAEYALEFARFVHNELIARVGTSGWRLAVTARRLQSGEPTVYLPRSMNWLSHDDRQATVDSPGIEFIDATDDPANDAVKLGQLVEWFSFRRDDVPFAEGGRVSAEAIRSTSVAKTK
jgi:hypothetical protein